MLNTEDNAIVKRFVNEYRNGTVNLSVTENAFERYPDQALPDWLARLTLFVNLLWVLLWVGYSLYNGIAGNGWESTLVIPGIILAFFLGSYYPSSMILSIVILGFSISVIIIFPHWLFGGTIGFFGLASLTRRVNKWHAGDRLKRLALGCDDNFLNMLQNGSIKISL